MRLFTLTHSSMLTGGSTYLFQTLFQLASKAVHFIHFFDYSAHVKLDHGSLRVKIGVSIQTRQASVVDAPNSNRHCFPEMSRCRCYKYQREVTRPNWLDYLACCNVSQWPKQWLLSVMILSYVNFLRQCNLGNHQLRHPTNVSEFCNSTRQRLLKPAGYM